MQIATRGSRTCAADPHIVVESDKSIKARWRNEAGDLFLDEAAESGCCFVAAACRRGGFPTVPFPDTRAIGIKFNPWAA
jgi:hypothetical protein